MTEEAEPRVVTADVRRILREVVRPGRPDEGDAVSMLATRASTSTRTIYRILGGDYKATMKLELADSLLLSVGHHLLEVQVELPSGERVNYLDMTEEIDTLTLEEREANLDAWRQHLGDDRMGGFGGRGPAEYEAMAQAPPAAGGLLERLA